MIVKKKPIYSYLQHSRYYLAIELISIYFIIPSVLYFFNTHSVLPVLWVIAAICVLTLYKDSTFEKKNLWRASALMKHSMMILTQFIILSILLFILDYYFTPELLFSFIKYDPWHWVIIIFLYPFISVYPQELVYRTFFFHRYQSLLNKKWNMLIINAVLFSYMHIIFHNWIAMVLTLAGGFLFAWLYERTRSTLLTTVAHTLYGNVLFTLGLGTYFQNGTLGTIY